MEKLVSPEHLPHKDNVPQHSDQRRIEEITRIVLQVLEAEKVSESEEKSRFLRVLDFLASHWVIAIFLLSAGGAVIAWVLYGTSLLYRQEQLAREQFQARASAEIGDQYVDSANALLNVGQAEAAKAEFEKALTADPLNTEAQEGVMKSDLFIPIEEQQYDPGATEQKLRMFAETDPSDTHVWAFLGDVFRYYNSERALDNYQKAVAYDRDNAYAYSGMASLYYVEGKYDKSLEMAKKAYDLAPWDSSFKHNYANALYAKGRYQDAIAEYEDLIAWDWQYLWAHNGLAQLYRLTGSLNSAQGHYEQFIAILENEEVHSLERNQGGVLFPTGSSSKPVYLYENPEVRYYTYYSIALTACLRGHTEETESYMSKAQDIPIHPYLESEVKRLIEYDIELLQEEQEGFKAKADHFRAKYL
jgi:tetratricopeptide (TPR) repeat protein